MSEYSELCEQWCEATARGNLHHAAQCLKVAAQEFGRCRKRWKAFINGHDDPWAGNGLMLKLGFTEYDCLHGPLHI